jgi:hypothetical protein
MIVTMANELRRRSGTVGCVAKVASGGVASSLLPKLR